MTDSAPVVQNPRRAPPQVLNLGPEGHALCRDIRENHRLARNERISALGQEILEELLAVIPDIKGPVTFAVANDRGFASAVTRLRLVIVDRRLLEMIETRDELAGVIGHELGHFVWRKKHGETDRVSAAEEAFADAMGQKAAADAGYSKKGQAYFIEKLIRLDREDSKHGYTAWLKLPYGHVDPHLTPISRYVNLESDFEGATRLSKGESHLHAEEREFTGLPDWWKREASSVVHRSFMGSRKMRAGYSKLCGAKKINFLAEFVPHITNSAREEDYFRELEKVRKDYRKRRVKGQISPDEKRQIDEAIDELVESCVNEYFVHNKGVLDHHPFKQILQKTYDILSSIDLPDDGDSDQELNVVGPYKVLKNALNDFFRAQRLEDAVDAARRYIDGYERLHESMHDVHHDGFWYVEWPRRIASEGFSEKDRLISWLRADDSRTIARFVLCANPQEEDILDWLPLDVVKSFRDQEGNDDFFLESTIEKREKYEGMALPPDPVLAKTDPAQFAEKYDILLEHPEKSAAKRYERWHPYFGKRDREIADIYFKSAGLLCEGLQAALRSDDPERQEKGRRLVLKGLQSEWKRGPFANVLCDDLDFPKHEFVMNLNRYQESPFLRFMRENAASFSVSERIFLVGHILQDVLHIEEHKTAPLGLWARHASLTLPRSLEDLETFLRETGGKSVRGDTGIYFYLKEGPIDRDPPPDDYWGAVLSPLPLQSTDWWMRLSNKALRFINEIPSQMLLSILPAHGRGSWNGTTDERLRLIRIGLRIPPLRANSPLWSAFPEVFREYYWRSYRQTGDVEQGLPEGLSAEEMVAAYLLCERWGLFQSSEMRTAWGDFLVDAIESRTDPSERFDLYTKALSGPGLSDINLRKRVISGLARADAEYMGLDDGSEEYRKHLKPVLKGRRCIMQRSSFCRMLAASSEAIAARRETAFMMRDSGRLQGDEFADFNLQVRGAEFLLGEIGKNPVKVKEFLDFMTSTGEREHIESFRLALNEWFSNWFPRVTGEGLFEKHRADTAEGRRHEVERARVYLYDLHRHFWEQNLEVRTLILKPVLITPARFHEDRDAALAEASSLVLDRLFPSGGLEPGSADERNTYWARTLVETLIECSHETEQGLMLSALVAASQKIESEGGHMRPGLRLKAVLSSLGPAYIKLGQAIHSYPSTPADIKEDIVDLKGMTEVPVWWDLYEMIDDVVPEEKRARINHLKKVVGAASFNVVVLYETPEGEEEAVSLLRRHALAQGLKGFDVLSEVTATLADRHEDFRPWRQDALNIIRKSRDMTYVETDMSIGARQAEVQRDLYDGMCVRANSTVFEFRSARWLDYGDGFRFMEAARGVPFDKLPEGTDAEKSFKDNAAIAILTMELRNILRGGRFDCDRHERQCAIEGTTIHVFDVGGISIEEPTDQEKQTLGRTLASIAKNKAAKNDMLKSTMAALAGESHASDYLSRIQRALFSLSFAIERIRNEDLPHVLLSVLQSGEADAVIKRAFLEEMTGSGILASVGGFDFLLRKFGKKNSLCEIVGR